MTTHDAIRELANELRSELSRLENRIRHLEIAITELQAMLLKDQDDGTVYHETAEACNELTGRIRHEGLSADETHGRRP